MMTADTNPGQARGSKELGAFSDVDRTDADDFIDRLDRMRALREFAKYKQQTYEELRLEPGHKVADIGCGAGDDAYALAGMVPQGKVTGVDLSESMVAEARKRFGDTPNLEFIASGIENLPFADNSLDAIRADRLLIHVPDTRAALAELLRVLKPGGRLTLSEPDMAAAWVASDWPDVSYTICEAVARSCVNPFFPRQMSVTLRELGLDDIEAVSFGIIGHDYDVANRSVSFDALAQAAKARGELSDEQIDAWRADLDTRKAENRFASGMTLIVASATKPA